MANILNLPSWRVLSVDEHENDIAVSAEPVEALTACPHCTGRLLRFGKRAQVYMHMPMHGKRVGIHVDRQRFRCDRCAKVVPQPLPDIDEKHRATTGLVEYVKRRALDKTFVEVSAETGIAQSTVRRIFDEHAEELKKATKFETPKRLGIDEITIRRTPRLILTNIEEQTVYDLLATNKESVVEAYLEKLPDKHEVRVVAIDMHLPYKRAVKKTIPHAVIVADKFHVLRMANAALDAHRKSLRASLSDKDRRRLMRHRHILLKREHRLKDAEKLKYQMWIAAFPELGVMHQLKEEFYRIYDAPNSINAKKRYREWLEKIPDELRPWWKDLTTAWGNWEAEILAFWDALGSTTNALTEGKNRVIREVDGKARGYSFAVLRTKILHKHGHKKVKVPVYGLPRRPMRPGTIGMMQMEKIGEREANFGTPISTFWRLWSEGLI